MTTTTAATDDNNRMTKEAWDLQKTLGEMSTWRTWGVKTLEAFRAELKELQSRRRMPTEDIGNITLVLAKVDETLKAMKEMDGPLHKATGQRIRKNRKG